MKRFGGINGNFTRLDGEYDLNFRIDSGYILKVMRAGCDSGLVDLQCRALEHLHGLPLPPVVPSKNGRPFEILKDETGVERILWIIEKP